MCFSSMSSRYGRSFTFIRRSFNTVRRLKPQIKSGWTTVASKGVRPNMIYLIRRYCNDKYCSLALSHRHIPRINGNECLWGGDVIKKICLKSGRRFTCENFAFYVISCYLFSAIYRERIIVPCDILRHIFGRVVFAIQFMFKFDSNDCFAPIRRGVITWTNDDLFYRRIQNLSGLNVFTCNH